MWTDIKEAFSVLSYLDLAALVVIAYEVHARGWPWVKAKLLTTESALWSRVKTLEVFVEDIMHRVKSVEDILVQAKIAVPAPDPNVGGHPPVVGPQPPATPPKV